jgi:hypothetical protein
MSRSYSDFQFQKCGLNTALALTDLTVRSVTSDQISRDQNPCITPMMVGLVKINNETLAAIDNRHSDMA